MLKLKVDRWPLRNLLILGLVLVQWLYDVTDPPDSKSIDTAVPLFILSAFILGQIVLL